MDLARQPEPTTARLAHEAKPHPTAFLVSEAELELWSTRLEPPMSDELERTCPG